MTLPTDDEKLKQAFGALKREDARDAPSFESIAKRPKRRRSPWVVVVPLASVGAAAAAMLLVWSSTTSMAPQAAAPGPASRSDLGRAGGGGARESDGVAVTLSDPAPLDFLLDLPGSSALAATTSFDTKVFR